MASRKGHFPLNGEKHGKPRYRLPGPENHSKCLDIINVNEAEFIKGELVSEYWKGHFPFNDEIHGKSRYPLTGPENHSKCIDIINVNEAEFTKGELVSEYIKSKNGYILFYHGTTSQNATALVKSGIDVNKCNPLTDFGKGFYVSEGLDYAREHAKNKCKEYTVLVFKLTKTFWDAQRGFGYFFKDDSESKSESDVCWEEFVEYNRHCLVGGKRGKKKVKNIKQLESKAFIKGHVCAKNLKRTPGTSNQTVAKDPAIQVCIRTNELAVTFFSYLDAAFSYDKLLYK